MEDSLISVIITTYKREEDVVKRAVDSVLNQTYNNIEIIIVDDSPDDYERRKNVENMIISLKDSRIKYIKHDVNLGACAARNTGIKESKGMYIAFLDDDDEWLPTKLEKQISLISKPNIGLVYCKQIIYNETFGKTYLDNHKRYKGQVFDKLLRDNFIGSTSFALIRRECFDTCGLFNVNLKSAQDYDMWLRIAKSYSIDYVDEPLVIYHVHKNERISSNPLNKIQGLEMINSLYREDINKNRGTKSIRIFKLVPHYMLTGNIKKSFKCFLQAFVLTPYKLNYIILFIKYTIISLRHYLRSN